MCGLELNGASKNAKFMPDVFWYFSKMEGRETPTD